MFAVKRIYDDASKDDGYRVLVDRLWPRGVTKEHARLDLWLKDAAPSNVLRTWYGHIPERFPEFRHRYEAELQEHHDVLGTLLDAEKEHGKVTLLFGARDREHNEAVVLCDMLGREKAPAAQSHRRH